MVATQDDAALVVQILQWGAQIGIEAAAAEIYSDSFDPDTASTADTAVRTVLNFGEVLGTFVKHEVLASELVRDLWSVEITWPRLEGVVHRLRERLGEPRMYENFEALATRTAR